MKFLPARPVERGRMGDLAEHAAPFDDDAVNVARAEEVGDPRVFVERVFVDAGDDLFRTRAVFGRHTIFEVTGNT